MHRRLLPLALLAALACEKPGVAPGLDQDTCDGGPCLAPGIIQGSLVYAGPARGDAILLLFDTGSLPPPDGNGTSAAAIARIPQATLFGAAGASSVGPFSAPFVFTQVPSGRSYQIRAFLDVTHEFDPFFDFTQQPRAGAPAGGHGELDASGQPHLTAIAVAPAAVVAGVNVALTQTIPYDPPSFAIAGGSQTIDVGIDQPVRMRLQITQLSAAHASFSSAHFALEYDLDASGNRRSTFGGLDDVFPRVILRQIREADGTPAAKPAIVPCQTLSTPVLPAIAAMKPGDVPPALDNLDVFVEPFAVSASDLSPLPSIPKGVYQVVVIEKTGQVWTLPNQLGTQFGVESQAQTVTFDAHVARPPNSVSGSVTWSGDPSIKSGNIVVQAYADLPYAPPPPNGAALPVRVQIIPAARVTRTSDGFTAPYAIDGLPQGNYIIQALDDVDGNFAPLNLLQTPSKGDLVGAVIDVATLRPASVAVSGNVTGKDVTLAQRIPLDPPAFVVDPATPAQMPADQVTPVRFDLRAQANSFPAGAVAAPHFTVELVRNSGGAVVDADQDGLPDVWPKVFLVRLASSDPAGLTQFVSPDTHQTATQVIPAAIDPTPFIAALQPRTAAPVVTDRLTVIARPALLDASDPTLPPQRMQSLQPGAYKIVLLERSGQVW
ncbi:MAG: hypothetical protein LC689_11215, partial [Myxococcales bacterium]|nr:hypothetical protein [Myxococcales bacterium]